MKIYEKPAVEEISLIAQESIATLDDNIDMDGELGLGSNELE